MLLPELIDHIFSFLREDTAALDACSKAHPLCSRLAERHLYTDIVIQLSDPQGISQLFNQLDGNSRILCYPRTLKVIGHSPLVVYPQTLSLTSMIPRMTNLFSFCLYGPGCHGDRSSYEEFMSTLGDALQQSSIERVCLHCRLIHSSEKEESSSSSPHLDALVMSGLYNQDIHFWGTHRATPLKSLRDITMVSGLSPYAKLLTACPNSLTSLHINLSHHCQGVYSYSTDGHLLEHRFEDDEPQSFPFTLSALMNLKKLSIFTVISSSSATDSIEVDSSLPPIIQLIQTAPSIEHLILSVHYSFFNLAVTGPLDWSPLRHLQSDVSGIQRPCIDVYVSGEGMRSPVSDESILGALAENEVLMDLVNRGVVTLKLGSVDQAT